MDRANLIKNLKNQINRCNKLGEFHRLYLDIWKGDGLDFIDRVNLSEKLQKKLRKKFPNKF